VISLLLVSAAPPAGAAAGKIVAHNTPAFVSTAQKLGAIDPTKTIDITLWLNLHNRSELDALAEQIYDRTSPNYRHFLKRSEFAVRFAPTVAEAMTVLDFVEGHNLKVVNVGPDNVFVRARGTVSDIQTAFRVRLNQYQVGRQTHWANDRDPYVEGAAASLVRSISGLDDSEYTHPMMARPTSLSSGKVIHANASAASTLSDADFFSSNCFDGVEKETFSNNNAGSYPIGTYSGNHLNIQSLSSAGCAYTPPVIQAAYSLTGLYNEGFTGAGQTIAIIDWCGSTTIQEDANAFSAKFGLPKLTSANFNIVYTPTASLCNGPDNVEINIDVEWAHAVAPGADITLIVPPSSSAEDIDSAEFTTIDYGLGNVISASFGAPESLIAATELENGNLLSELAAVYGISVNFATGDGGDYTALGIPATVSFPADSPFSTAVGGVSLALNPDNSIAWQAGWGNNETQLAQDGTISNPPEALGFDGGAGGGPSNCFFQGVEPNSSVHPDSPVQAITCLAGFPKPSYQEGVGVPGKVRQLPDVSWLADPFTGVAILISIPDQVPEKVWQVWGGTSVATPMFSALWAIANEEAQANGGPPLGQAAPYLYTLPSEAIYDIVPFNSPTNVVASIQSTATSTQKYSASKVLGDATPAKFVSAIWDDPDLQNTALVVSFGTDCSTFPPATLGVIPCDSPSALHTNAGWDNVTGVGTPNAKAFADAFADSKPN
jgi:subtilase family serine protease